MITDLVTNGCSYMATYTKGLGHVDLAKRFDLTPRDISITGSANSRIIRTTLKHSHETTKRTLYVLGMTFISREELPICRWDDGIYPTEQEVWEGAWTNPQNQLFGKNRWVDHWTEKHTQEWIKIRERYEVGTLLDRLEDLQYRMLSMIESLLFRGHRVIVFQQADQWWDNISNKEVKRLQKLGPCKQIIDGFRWCAIRWQHSQGVPYTTYSKAPDEIKHRQPGRHTEINDYLERYIRQHELHL